MTLTGVLVTAYIQIPKANEEKIIKLKEEVSHIKTIQDSLTVIITDSLTISIADSIRMSLAKDILDNILITIKADRAFIFYFPTGLDIHNFGDHEFYAIADRTRNGYTRLAEAWRNRMPMTLLTDFFTQWDEHHAYHSPSVKNEPSLTIRNILLRERVKSGYYFMISNEFKDVHRGALGVSYCIDEHTLSHDEIIHCEAATNILYKVLFKHKEDELPNITIN